MSYYLQCSIDAFPCSGIYQSRVDALPTAPATPQSTASAPTLADYEAMGITGEALSIAVGAGFAIIFSLAALGLAVGSAIKTIRQL